MLSLDHVVFPVADASRTLAFYRGVPDLPLEDAMSGDDWGGRPWLMMMFGLGGGQQLVTVVLRGACAPGMGDLPAEARHYALSVEALSDLDIWRARLNAAGIGFEEEAHGGQTSLYFRDPDGVVLEIAWRPPSSAKGTAALRTVQAWVAG